MPTRRQLATVVAFPKSPEPVESPNIIPSLRQCVVEIVGALQKLSFGSLADGEKAGHHDMSASEFLTPTVANTEFKVYHTLGRRPVGRIITGQDNVGLLYDVKHKWTAEYAVFKSNRTSQTMAVIFL